NDVLRYTPGDTFDGGGDVDRLVVPAVSNGDVIVYSTAVVLTSDTTATFDPGCAEIIDVASAGYSVAVRRAAGVGYHVSAYGRFPGPIFLDGARADVPDYYEALPIQWLKDPVPLPAPGDGPRAAPNVLIYVRPGDHIHVDVAFNSGWLNML